jgi:hypothetical protein
MHGGGEEVPAMGVMKGGWPGVRSGAAALLLLLLLAATSPVSAQDAGGEPQQHLDNIYGGFDHQPSRAEVQGLEKQDGTGLSQQQNAQDSAIVDKLYQQLEGTPDGTAPAQPKKK